MLSLESSEVSARFGRGRIDCLRKTLGGPAKIHPSGALPHVGTFGPPRVLNDPNDPGLAVGSNMDKVAAYAISAFIIGFGLWIIVAGLSSNAPVFWFCVAFIPMVVGIWSAVGPT